MILGDPFRIFEGSLTALPAQNEGLDSRGGLLNRKLTGKAGAPAFQIYDAGAEIWEDVGACTSEGRFGKNFLASVLS